MKISVDINKEGPVYTARVVGLVAASPGHVLDMLTTPEGALGFRLMKKVALWEPDTDGTSVRVRYEMATIPSFDIDVIVSRRDAKHVFFSSADDTWVDMKGSWKVKPSYFFGHTSHVVLENTITIHSFWLRLLPLHGIIESTVKSLFEDLNERREGRLGFWKRLIKKCLCCLGNDDDGHDDDDGRPSVPVEQHGPPSPRPLHGPIPADETSATRRS
jgi:hypothetical protein